MTDRRPIAEADLHRAADGRLDPERQRLVEAHLAANPAEAERVAFYRRLNEELHRLYDPLLAEPATVLWPPPARPVGWGRQAARAAAAIALFLGGLAAGWLLRGGPTEGPAEADRIARQAATAHALYAVEVRHPVEVPGEEEAHLVQWLSKRLGGEVRAPRLDALGYRLVGGRLLPAEGGVAAQFMYENPAGTRVTLYVKSGDADDETSFRFLEREGLSIFYWRDGRFGYALSGPLPRESLLAICNAVYAQLTPGADPSGW